MCRRGCCCNYLSASVRSQTKKPWCLPDTLGTLSNKVKHLIKLGGKEIETGQNTTIGAQVVSTDASVDVDKWVPLCVYTLLLHYFFVVDGVSDVNIGCEWKRRNCRVEIQHIGRCLFLMKVSIDSLDTCFKCHVSQGRGIQMPSCLSTCMKVVLPEPAMPMHRMTGGCFFSLFSVDMSKFVVVESKLFFFPVPFWSFCLLSYVQDKSVTLQSHL